MADYVLSDFNAQEREALPEIVDRAVKALRLVMRRGLGEASKALNTRPKPPKPERPESPPATEPGSDPTNKQAGDTPEGVALFTEKS
jgi:PTH1 family peptidyl-tRNA hydrolase